MTCPFCGSPSVRVLYKLEAPNLNNSDRRRYQCLFYELHRFWTRETWERQTVHPEKERPNAERG